MNELHQTLNSIGPGLALLGIAPADVIDAGQKIGTASNQVILGILLVVMILCVIALGAVIGILHKANQRTIEVNQARIAAFIDKMDKKEAEMTAERVRRIEMLMQLLRDDVAAKKDVAHAMDLNTQVIRELKEFMRQDLKEFIREVMQGAARG